MAEAPLTYLLDTSAILAHLLNEPEAPRVRTVFQHAALASISIAELYAALWMRFGQAKANEVVAAIKQWQRPWLWLAEEILLTAGRLRATHRLGLGDSLIAALALGDDITLVTKDPDFRPLAPSLKLLYL